MRRSKTTPRTRIVHNGAGWYVVPARPGLFAVLVSLLGRSPEAGRHRVA